MKKPNGYWNYDRCKEEALKYTSRNVFKNNSMTAYVKSKNKKWLNDICSHMVKKTYHCYWTKEKCKVESLKYNTRKDFYTHSPGAYKKSMRCGWLKEVCSHMMALGNKYKRCIYVWEFDDKSAYIGLTYNLTNRINRHKRESSSVVNEHLKMCNGTCKQLTDYIDIEESKLQENYYIEYYKNNNWSVLNKRPGGGLVAFESKLTKKECKDISSKYINKYDFRKNETTTYNLICRKKWLDVCIHMTNKKNRSDY